MISREEFCHSALRTLNSALVASVAGLAPARVGLKTRLLELLCIHGHENRTQGDETHRVARSQVSLNPVVSNPPWR